MSEPGPKEQLRGAQWGAAWGEGSAVTMFFSERKTREDRNVSGRRRRLRAFGGKWERRGPIDSLVGGNMPEPGLVQERVFEGFAERVELPLSILMRSEGGRINQLPFRGKKTAAGPVLQQEKGMLWKQRFWGQPEHERGRGK